MMSFIDKLFPSRKKIADHAQPRQSCNRDNIVTPLIGTEQDNSRDSKLHLGANRVRVLLFRECEWRGRKLLFDSLTLERHHRCKNEVSISGTIQNNAKHKDREAMNITQGWDVENKEKPAEDDINLLSEMVFGTVAMTYRGPSLKVHSMTSPACIMCTKVFPATEHNSSSTCRQSEKSSDEALGRSVNLDPNSSNSSMRTSTSPLNGMSAANLSSNDLSVRQRNSSTCSSIGSGWDLDVLTAVGSSQSLESNSSSSGGSLSSLRRRWFRAISTSLNRSDSDDAFGIHPWSENGNSENQTTRHRTRLGLAMLLRYRPGHEREIETRLLEHMAFLEGMLDRLRYFSVETRHLHVNGHDNSKKLQLAERMQRDISRFIISLLRFLMNVSNFQTPLLWHEVLLNSVITVEEKTNRMYQGLEKMCQLLDDADTKSTNFFLSTIITAVLTYHLGWVYTIMPRHDLGLMEKWGRCYPCNPLWAQLGDLYGALGNPLKVVHTVIAADTCKSELINSVLSFLSYFIRSGIVQKQKEYRCSVQQDFDQAIRVLEQVQKRYPLLFNVKRSNNNHSVVNQDHESCISSLEKQQRSRTSVKNSCINSPDHGSFSVTRTDDTRSPESIKQIERSSSTLSSLKRTSTIKSSLDDYPSVLKSCNQLEPNQKETHPTQQFDQSNDKSFHPDGITTNNPEPCTLENSSKVKIVVNESTSPLDQEKLRFFVEKDLQKRMDGCGDSEMERYEGSNLVDPFIMHARVSHLVQPDSPLLNQDSTSEDKPSQVFFTLGPEDKQQRQQSQRKIHFRSECRCFRNFNGVPSTSAQLPEGVLRKIIQRNFPESKSVQSASNGSCMDQKSVSFCLRCHGTGQGYRSSFNQDCVKQLLETPTNATEVLRTCANIGTDRDINVPRSNSLEALMEANSVVELPMPRSRKVSVSQTPKQDAGFTKTLVQSKLMEEDNSNSLPSGYTWGLVVQGLIKNTRKKRKRKELRGKARGTSTFDGKEIEEEEEEEEEVAGEKDWWWSAREEISASVKFSAIDQPISEAFCILGDLDTWQVGLISNNTPFRSQPIPVGMSRLVSNMLEAFAYIWRKYHSPVHCVEILEGRLKEMWLRSEALAELLMTIETCDANIANLTNALDLDAADVPLLLAVATTHSPQIAQRFELTLA